MTRAARALVRRLEREDLAGARWVTRAWICDHLSISDRTLARWVANGTFPKAEIPGGTGASNRWRLSTVAGWEAKRMQGAA